MTDCRQQLTLAFEHASDLIGHRVEGVCCAPHVLWTDLIQTRCLSAMSDLARRRGQLRQRAGNPSDGKGGHHCGAKHRDQNSINERKRPGGAGVQQETCNQPGTIAERYGDPHHPCRNTVWVGDPAQVGRVPS